MLNLVMLTQILKVGLHVLQTSQDLKNILH